MSPVDEPTGDPPTETVGIDPAEAAVVPPQTTVRPVKVIDAPNPQLSWTKRLELARDAKAFNANDVVTAKHMGNHLRNFVKAVEANNFDKVEALGKEMGAL